MLPTIAWIGSKISDYEQNVLSHLRGYEVRMAADAADLRTDQAGRGLAAIIVACALADGQATRLLERFLVEYPATPILFHDPDGRVADACRLTRMGAFHCLTGKLELQPLSDVLEAAVEYRHHHDSQQLQTLANRVSREPWRELLVGESLPMERLAQLISLIGARRSTVLITGETGTGKEVVARAIHMASGRSHLPMVAVNCSAIPETLLEAELFGHTKGAFTGAAGPRAGRFEQANRSTIFLDEIGDLPLDLQSKLLRVLQERELQRIGGAETIRLDVRVIAATNVNLAEAVQKKAFREDLFYRLNVVPVQLPPLRQRLSDIPLLVHHFIDKICRSEDLSLKKLTPEALGRLGEYSWPGNVRQLEHAVEMAVVLSGDRRLLHAHDFSLPVSNFAMPPAGDPVIEVPEDGLDFEEMILRVQRSLLEQALQKSGGNKARAAEMLRLKRSTLVSKVKALG